MLAMFEAGYRRMLAINAALADLKDADTATCFEMLARFDVYEKHARALLVRDERGWRGFTQEKIDTLAACIAQLRGQLDEDYEESI